MLEDFAKEVKLEEEEELKKALRACIGTKFSKNWGELVVHLSLESCKRVLRGGGKPSKLSVEMKRYAKVEKVPGGLMEESRVVDGVMLNKDVTHASMRRKIENPRVVLLDCPLEYKKGES